MKLLHIGKLNDGNILQPEVKGGCRPNKPFGKNIIWTSPIESDWGWKEWCASVADKDWCIIDKDEFLWRLQEERWVLELDERARVIKIDSLADLEALVTRFPFLNSPSQFGGLLDWSSIGLEYDALWLTKQGQKETEFSKPRLDHWACETVVIFNAVVVKTVERVVPPRVTEYELIRRRMRHHSCTCCQVYLRRTGSRLRSNP